MLAGLGFELYSTVSPKFFDLEKPSRYDDDHVAIVAAPTVCYWVGVVPMLATAQELVLDRRDGGVTNDAFCAYHAAAATSCHSPLRRVRICPPICSSSVARS